MFGAQAPAPATVLSFLSSFFSLALAPPKPSRSGQPDSAVAG
jgi:hypothetical protein